MYKLAALYIINIKIRPRIKKKYKYYKYIHQYLINKQNKKAMNRVPNRAVPENADLKGSTLKLRVLHTSLCTTQLKG